MNTVNIRPRLTLVLMPANTTPPSAPIAAAMPQLTISTVLVRMPTSLALSALLATARIARPSLVLLNSRNSSAVITSTSTRTPIDW